MADPLTWANVRFSLLYQATTGGTGWIYVPFDSPFPNACTGVSVSLDDSGGPKKWCLGIVSRGPNGFYAAISDDAGAPVVGQLLGVHYWAIGN